LGSQEKAAEKSTVTFPLTYFDLFCLMSSNSRISQGRRGSSPKVTPIFEIGRRKFVLQTQQSALRRTLYDSSSSSSSPIPFTFNMTSSRNGSGTEVSTSSQPSTSYVIGSIYSHQIPIQSTINPSKVIKKYGFFQFEEDATTTPWHMSSPLNLAPATQLLPKFKDHLQGKTTERSKEGNSEKRQTASHRKYGF
jgi:hypothetical protein